MRRLITLLAIVLSAPLAFCSWTHTQFQFNNGCTTNTCAVTVTSTGSHHLLIAGVTVNTNTAITISSVTSGACNASWTHAPNTAVSFAGNGSSDIFYCTDSVSGQTSISITVSGAGWSGGGGASIWEASSSLGNIAIDSGGTPSGNVTDAACTACAGVSLTLSGNNNYMAAMSVCVNGCTAVTGTGCSFDTGISGQGYGHCLTSGSQAIPNTWTQGVSGVIHANAVAIQESTGGGGGTTAVNKKSKVRRMMGLTTK